MMDHMRVDPGGFQMPGMPRPQLLNQPPQIFGAYSHDGLPVLPPELAAQMAFDPSALLDDANEAKRRRIARACDMCRKKKIKCDGKLPACTHCINYKTDCVFTQVEKKRNPPKGAKYIEGLENRLGRMESLLRLSGLLGDDDESTDLATLEKRLSEKHQQSRQASQALTSNPTSPSQATPGQDGTVSTPRSSVTSPEPNREKDFRKEHSPQPEKPRVEEEVEALSEMMCSLVTNQSGETRYIGSSSGFSIFSPKGIQWVNEKTGDTSFQQMISEVSIDDHKWNHWKPEIFSDLFHRPIYRPLPPKPEALSLLKDYFDNFNCMFPLFHQPTFMHLVERQYSNDPYQGSGWWASLNVALAIAHRLRVMSNLVPQEDDDKSWAYMKNAMGVFSELTMRNTDLLSVQALLGMASFMQGTPNPQPSFLLVAAAIRLSHSIGLHKRGSGFNLNPVEIEQRKRVFWIAYMLDKDLCLRSGRPPAQDDDDMNVELPDADPMDNIGNIPLADGKGKMNLFRAMCELTVIESQVYKKLYSTKATKLSEGELLQTIGELDKQLETWKDNIPIDFRPEHEIKASHTPLILHVVMLHFSYYNALTTIHRMSVHHGYWTSRLSNYAIQGLNARPLNPRVFASAALCASAARASIQLLKYIPQGDFSCVWLILYFPVSALVTLFGNILQNPLDPRAKSDTKLMNLVVTFLSTLGQEAETGGVHRMLGVCSEFERIAKIVIDKAERDTSKRKRKSHDPAHRPSVGAVNSPSSMSQTNHNTHHTPRPSSSAATPTPSYTTQLSPKFNGEQNRANNSSNGGYSPMNTASSTNGAAPRDWPSSATTTPGPSTTGTTTTQEWDPNAMDFGNFSELTGFGQPIASPPLPGQNGYQPLLPQELWQMSGGLDWDWAEFTGGAYPSFENGKTQDGIR
ncbi:N-terminal binuclear Zn cluster-containing protein [Annulohypoxylon truncatum]|uniref:N-terminal binuclear Zn cluster-containing protein n=1 Tax=Annulohypoxylon truncatum TaxID=327061 RepID=UPI002007B5B2|nr:N-terminal binuclear Zn cluster-containing protein [Annulohypoxylon truncatum]KAI1215065.1 N-terminal binuclear Zn cluster-containing protein [Annulohypoxylon truncatum]